MSSFWQRGQKANEICCTSGERRSEAGQQRKGERVGVFGLWIWNVYLAAHFGFYGFRLLAAQCSMCFIVMHIFGNHWQMAFELSFLLLLMTRREMYLLPVGHCHWHWHWQRQRHRQRLRGRLGRHGGLPWALCIFHKPKSVRLEQDKNNCRCRLWQIQS